MKTAVVGAGLAGRMLAWRLAEQGAEVTLIDRNGREKTDAGRVAAAMIAPGTEAINTEPVVAEIGKISLGLWPQWLKALGEATGIQVPFQNQGTLVVAHPQDEAEWRRFMLRADTLALPLQQLDREGLRQTEAELADRFHRAAWFPDEGVLHNLELYRALETRLQQMGVEWIEHHHCGPLRDDGRVDGLATAFDRVFDCRGNGAREVMPGLRSVRGEVIRVSAPEVGLSRPVRLLHPRYPLYIAPRPGHEFVIGATQIESELDHPTTIRSALELLSALYSLHEGFSEATIISLDVGLRPALPDNLPRINWGERLVSFNGLFRHGYLFAPALVSDILAGLEQKAPRFPQLIH